MCTNREIKQKICDLYDDLFAHDGYGEMSVEIKILRREQKEIVVRCGKQYRFVVDFKNEQNRTVKKPVQVTNDSSLTAQTRGNKDDSNVFRT